MSLNKVAGGASQCGLFASRSITMHLLRGVIATGSLTWALTNHADHPVLAIGAAIVAIVSMRGCPMCWMVGLFETIAARIKRIKM